MLNQFSKKTLLTALGLFLITLFYLLFENNNYWGPYLDFEYFFSSWRFWFHFPSIFAIPLILFFGKTDGSKVYKLIILISFFISSLVFIFEGYGLVFYFMNLMGVACTSIFITKPFSLISIRFTKSKFKAIMISLIVVQFIWLSIYSGGNWDLYYLLKFSVPVLGSLLFIGLIYDQSPKPDGDIRDVRQVMNSINQRSLNNLLDPKNPIWLEILRYSVIIWSLLVMVFGFIFSILSTINLFGFFNIFIFLGFLIVSLIFALLNFVLGMISLNLLFNIQAIRVALEKPVNTL